MRDWARLGRSIEPAWSAARSTGVRRAIRARTSRRQAALAVAALACGFAVAFAGLRARPDAPATANEPTAAVVLPAEKVQTDSVTPMSDASEIAREGDRAYTLQKGAARFVVTHDEHRPFVVHAGDVEIVDLGTVFTVAFTGADELRIAVETGSVRVRHDGESADVAAGTHLEVAARTAPEPVATAAACAVKRDARKRDEVARLLRTADDARMAGRPADAVTSLRRIVREHPGDSRADAAAFTLGRVLMDDLNEPAQAAEAFESARAHDGPIAEDALAREVMARARAGEREKSRALAGEYERRYPHGTRAKEVSRFVSPR